MATKCLRKFILQVFIIAVDPASRLGFDLQLAKAAGEMLYTIYKEEEKAVWTLRSRRRDRRSRPSGFKRGQGGRERSRAFLASIERQVHKDLTSGDAS